MRSDEMQYCILFDVVSMGRPSEASVVKKWINAGEVINQHLVNEYASHLHEIGERFEIAPNNVFTVFADEIGRPNQSSYVVTVPNCHTGFKRMFIAVEVNHEDLRYVQVVYGPMLPTTLDHDTRTKIYLKYVRESDMLIVCNEEEFIEE